MTRRRSLGQNSRMRRTITVVLGACLIASAWADTHVAFPPWGLSLDYFDASVTAGNDFFRHANGRWLKSAVIPADRRVAGVNLEIDKGNEAKLRTIVVTLAAKPDAGLSAEERKLRDFYLAFKIGRASCRERV